MKSSACMDVWLTANNDIYFLLKISSCWFNLSTAVVKTLIIQRYVWYSQAKDILNVAIACKNSK